MAGIDQIQNRADRRLVTVTGPDKPGLVAAVSEVLAKAGCDIEDVSMTRLSGNFATMLLARGGDSDLLRESLAEVAHNNGLLIHVSDAVEPGEDSDPNGYIAVAGPNRIGIVATLSRILAAHQANITEMTTRLLERTQVPIYLVRIEVVIPGGWNALEADLRDAGLELGVEVRLESLERVDL